MSHIVRVSSKSYQIWQKVEDTPGFQICGTRLHGWLPLSSLTLVYLGAGATHWIAVLVAGPEPSRPASGASAAQAAWAPPAASGPLEHYPLQSSCL